METLLQDLWYGARTLRKNPAFSVVAIFTLTLGIGASTAMFTLVNSVLLRPLDYRDPDRLMMVWERSPRGTNRNVVSPANFFAWRREAKSFADLAASTDRPLNVSGGGEAEEVLTGLTTENYFTVLGARALHGRTYLDGEDAADVAVLSHELWRRRFGGDPSAVGRTLTVNGQPLTIVGVMPADFRSVGTKTDLWLPAPFAEDGRGRFLTVVGRLHSGVTHEAARAEMEGIGRRLEAAFPEFNTGWGINPVPIHEQVTGDVRPALLVLLGAVGILLLIACTNVASLLLARAAARRKEIAVRLSLGATRGRVIRQTLTESLLLAAVAGTLGLLLAVAGTEALVRVLPPDLALPRLNEVRVDGRVLAFAMGVSLLTGALFGIAPALLGSSVSLAETLRESMRGTTGGRSRLRGALVVAEVALAVVLLVGAGLLGRTLQRLVKVDTGLRTERVLTMRMILAGPKYQDQAALRGFTDALLSRLEALPGARAAGGETFLPLTGQKIGHAFFREDRPRPREGEEPPMDLRVAAGDYFAAMGIPLRKGRLFDARDHADAPAVFVINEAMAHRHFPGEDPVGKRLGYEWVNGTVSGEIVGVVGSVRELGPREEASPAIYRAYAQMPAPQMSFVVRTNGDPLALAAAAAAAVREIDPAQPLGQVRTMEQVAAETVARPRLNLFLLGGFAGVALLLASIGLYGIVSYSVTQRRHEIGVRMALGAGNGDVLRMVVRQGMGLTALGLAVGLVAALAMTRAMESLLFGVRPTDPLTLVAVSVFLAAMALVASWLPAHRATRVDPMVALRAE